MLSRHTEEIAAATMILKSIMNIVIFAFSVWVVYFSENSSHSLLQGTFVFLALSLTMGLLSQFPFGMTFAPPIIEWRWLDIEISEISAMAWSFVAISMILDCLLIGFVMRDSSAEGR